MSRGFSTFKKMPGDAILIVNGAGGKRAHALVERGTAIGKNVIVGF